MLEENKKLMSILKEEGKYIIDETTGATKKKNSQNEAELSKVKNMATET